jgi:hypothetical protein
LIYNVDSSLFKAWSLGVGRGHNRENHIYIGLYRTKNLLQNQQANFNQTWYKSFLGEIVQIKGQVLFKGEIITKMQKFGDVIEKVFL